MSECYLGITIWIPGIAILSLTQDLFKRYVICFVSGMVTQQLDSYTSMSNHGKSVVVYIYLNTMVFNISKNAKLILSVK